MHTEAGIDGGVDQNHRAQWAAHAPPICAVDANALPNDVDRLRHAQSAPPGAETARKPAAAFAALQTNTLLDALKSAGRLDRFFDARPEFVYFKDTENRNILVNQAVADSLGVTPEQIAGTPSERWYPKHANSYHQDDLEVMRTGAPKWNIVEPIQGVDGVARTFRTDKFPLRSLDGDVVGILVIARETSDNNPLREHVNRSASLEALRQLAAGTAHDLNNLLAVMLENINLAVDELPSLHPVQQSLETVSAAIRLSAGLTHRVLSFGQSQSNPAQAVSLNVLVEDTRKLLARVMPPTITIEHTLSANSPSVFADPAQLSQILVNLVINARDAMPNGGTITIVTESIADTNGERSILRVVDTGIGIADEIRATLFAPFTTTKIDDGSAGIGLANTHSAISDLGGNISFDSVRGQGAEFIVSLPAIPPHSHDVQQGMSARLNSSSRRALVLLVEDNDSVRRVHTRILERAGYRVLVAENAESAILIAKLSIHTIDLVITDVDLPGMNGLELVPELRAINPRLCAILTSGRLKPAQASAATANTTFLQKPFSREALLWNVAEELTREKEGGEREQ